jgi:cell division protein ZapD
VRLLPKRKYSLVEAGLDKQHDPVAREILYEHPLNERIRTFLRLESLFAQAAHHVKRSSEWDSRATLNCILEILSLFGNANLKSEVLKELERHAFGLKRLEHNPDIDDKQLVELLDVIGSHIDSLHRINGQVGSELKSSEFLLSIRQRSGIPGGTCDFDLPAFHYWLQQPVKERSDDLYRWLNSFDAIGQAIQFILKITRESTTLTPTIAEHGVYQQTLDPNLPYQMVRIALPADSPYFAELSGGRHRFTARFLNFSAVEDRARQTNEDVGFGLACCAL